MGTTVWSFHKLSSDVAVGTLENVANSSTSRDSTSGLASTHPSVLYLLSSTRFTP